MPQSKHAQCRLIQRNGKTNVRYVRLDSVPLSSNFFIFTNVSSWLRLILIYLATFVCSWTCFAILYHIIEIYYAQRLSMTSDNDDGVTRSADVRDSDQLSMGPGMVDKQHTCVVNMNDFISTLLFSIETQHTIGYGGRHPTTQCFSTILLLIIQSIMALFIQNITAQAVYMKFSRPHFTVYRRLTFGCKAQIYIWESRYLCVTLADHDTTDIINARIRLLCYRKRVTMEGEVIPFECYKLKLSEAYRYLPLSVSAQFPIVHRIDDQSPLADIDESTLQTTEFEIVVTLDGIYETTGFACHFRSSYLPDDIEIIRDQNLKSSSASKLDDQSRVLANDNGTSKKKKKKNNGSEGNDSSGSDHDLLPMETLPTDEWLRPTYDVYARGSVDL